MYCGDETGAFIGDVGSHISRFGYGGEDNPKYVTPSFVGSKRNGDDDKPKRSVLTSCYHDRFDEVQPVYRLAAKQKEAFPQVDPNDFLQQADFIENYDAYEYLWSKSFDVLRVREQLKHTKGGGTSREEYNDNSPTIGAGDVTSETVRSADATDTVISHPLLAVTHGSTSVVSPQDPAANPTTTPSGVQYHASMRRKQCMAMTEILMEALHAPAAFVAPTPMLASFCHGRQTSLVVDIGAGGCRVTPIIDGLVLRHAQRRNGRGGDWLGHVAAKAIMDYSKKSLVPRYLVSSSPKHKSKSSVFHTWSMLDVMYELRTSHHVSLAQWRYDPSVPFLNMESQDDGDDDDVATDEAAAEANSYELPDGTLLDLNTSMGKDLCRVPELLFTDTVPFVADENKNILSQSDTLSDLPLHKLIHASLTAVGDGDARKELCGNIILCGGSSLFGNLEQRLSYELYTIIPSTHKCRVLASRHSSERQHAAWIGGSILTSLGSFQQLWLSQQEYQEYGTTLAIQRFPV